MSEDKTSQTLFGEGVEDLSRMVEGVAGLLLGKPEDGSPDDVKPVISEDVDRAIQDLGGALGQVLLVAGDHLQAASGGVEDEGNGEDVTPLVHGARSFGRGLGALAGDLLGSLQGTGASSGSEGSSSQETEERT